MNSTSSLHMDDPNLVNCLIQNYDELDACLHDCDLLKLQSKLDYLLYFFIHNGQQMDRHPSLSNQLNIFFVVFRNLLRNNPTIIPYSIKLPLLRLIEFRSGKWRNKESLEDYYRQKIPFIDTFPSPPIRQRQQQNRKRNTLRASKSAGDVSNLNSSNNNHYMNSYNLFGGNGSRCSMSRGMKKVQFEGDILIKNSESGRVMGVKGRRVHMIEQLSNTVISFQKVPQSSLNRLVHITGPSLESIELAKSTILTTIRDNVSPITDDLSTSRESLGEFRSVSERTTESAWSNDDSLTSNVTPAPEYRFSLWIRGEEVTISLNVPQIGCQMEEFLAKNDFLAFVEKRFQESKEASNSRIYDRETLISLQSFATPISSLEIDPEFVRSNEDS